MTSCRLCLDVLTAAVPVLTPPPAGLDLHHAAEELARVAGILGRTCAPPVRTSRTSRRPRQLAARFVDAVAGETLVHTDVRDDNLLLTTDGRVLLCDWNWPMAGAAWLDSLFLLIGPRGDGLDVAAVIDRPPAPRQRCPTSRSTWSWP